jgi:signal transduction histidine kinase
LIGLLVCAWSAPAGRPSPRAIRRLRRLGARAALGVAAARLERVRAHEIVSRERERLRAVLHDGATQTLFSLGLKLELCRRLAADAPRLRALLEAVKKDAAMTMTHLRQLVAPTAVAAASGGIPSERVTAIIQEFRDLVGLPVLLIEEAPSLPVGPEALEALAMVVQAGLARVAHEGRMTRAEIRLAVSGDELVFEVTGHGPDGGAAGDGAVESFVGATMAERVRGVGGRVEMVPAPSTVLRLHGALPLGRRGDGLGPRPVSGRSGDGEAR